MSHVLCVRWTIVPQMAPQPWRHCRRCGGARRFQAGGKARVNANGRRVDAWLVYRCTVCDGTWNRPILERRPLRAIDPDVLGALMANDPTLLRRLAFDVEALGRWTGRVEFFHEVVVTKTLLAESVGLPRRLKILCSVPEPVGLRLDRLLGRELGVPRSLLRRLERRGDLVLLPPGSRLGRPVREGACVVVTLPALGEVGPSVAANARIFPTHQDFSDTQVSGNGGRKAK